MLELQDIRYIIKKEDMYLTKFPYMKVIQPKYGLGFRELDILKVPIVQYIKTSRQKNSATINEDIYSIVRKLREKYATWFEDVGWYTRKLIVMLFIEGRLQCNGSVATIQELEALETLKAAERTALNLQREAYNRRYSEAFEVYLKEQEQIYNTNRELSIGCIEIGDTFKNKAEIVDALSIYLGSIKAYARKWLTVPEYLQVEYDKVGSYWKVVGITKEPVTFYRMESWLHNLGAKRKEYERIFFTNYKEEQNDANT